MLLGTIALLHRQIARWVLLQAMALGVIGIVAEGLGRAPGIIIFAVALAVAIGYV